ncbi:hypothetical protein IW262DRAFT_1455194 [Armillaria fumosa]|nr:hypothetical protein IW262DRAFT_1455194 [Armillaria fumosa]
MNSLVSSTEHAAVSKSLDRNTLNARQDYDWFAPENPRDWLTTSQCIFSKVPHSVMFHLLVNMCIFTAIIPLASALIISMESAPVSLQATPIGLRWEHHDPRNFVLGAFLANGSETMVATMMQAVEIFTADRIVDMVFNYTNPSEKDCTLMNYFRPRDYFAESKPFTVTDGRPKITGAFEQEAFSSTVLGAVPNTSSPTAFNSTSSVPRTVSNVPPKPASHTGVIVGDVLGFLALGCMASASICVLLRRQRSKAGNMLLLRSQDITAPPPAPFLLKYSSQRDAGAQEHVPAVLRNPLDAEIVRVREENRSLQLDNQIRRMEAGYESLPPPSYRSGSSSSRSISFDT